MVTSQYFIKKSIDHGKLGKRDHRFDDIFSEAWIKTIPLELIEDERYYMF